jgi:hypothetical protein
MAFLLATSTISQTPTEAPPVKEATVETPGPPAVPTEAFGVPLPPWTCGTDSIDLARKLLPKSFKRHMNSKHVILTDASWDSLIQIRTSLRRAWGEYRSLCRRLGVSLKRPDEKLACIVFNDHEDFLAFSRKTLGDSPMLEHAGGYYCPRFNWIVFYEPEHQEMIDSENRRLDEYQQHVDQSRQAAGMSELDAETAMRVEEALRRQQQFIDDTRTQISTWANSSRTRIAIHEAIHQFTQVCTDGKINDPWPNWLHEGLATSFETSDATLGFGPDRLAIHRDEPFIGLVNSDQLIPLREFIAKDGYGEKVPSSLHVFYAQAYGLITWLYEYRTPQLASFLKHLSTESEDGGSHDVETVFEKHFGNIENLQKRWMRIEQTDWRSKRHD